MMTVEDIYKVLPEHESLKDPALKEACAKAYLEAIRINDWESKGGIANCCLQIGLLAPDCPASGLEHMQLVSQVARSMSDYLGPWLEGMGCKLNRDYAIAGALLHDVGKVVIYDADENGNPTHSKYNKYYNHCETGAYVAVKAGVPYDIVNVILAHSPVQCPGGPGYQKDTEELMIVKLSDHIAWDSVAVYWPKPAK